MSCTTCTPATTLKTCSQDIVLGTITATGVDVYIYVKDIITGAIYRQSTTSANDGTVTYTQSDNPRFIQPERTYDIWVTLQMATNPEAMEELTIGVSTATCISVEFIRILNADGSVIADTNTQVIEI